MKAGSHLVLLSLLALTACVDHTSPETVEVNREVFRDVSAEVGLDHQHSSGASGQFYFPEIVGSGVSLFDHDNDGDLDIYLLQGSLIGEQSLATMVVPPADPHWQGHRLFRNTLIPDGALRFEEVSADVGLRHEANGMGAAVGDIDGDGDLDLYATHFGSNVLYRNDGHEGFVDITAAARTDDGSWSTSAAFFDYDRDSDLDLFVVNYVDFRVSANKRCHVQTGRPDYCGPQEFPAAQDRLFRNDGNGTFTDVSRASGIAEVPGPGLGVTVADFDRDGWLDVYVANDGEANRLWINQTDGRFEDQGLISGTAFNRHGKSEASMGVAAGDIDDDGDDDLFMTHLFGETNTLYLNDGTGRFADATSRLQLGHPSLPFTGFGSDYFDFDHDGHLDLFVANGAVMINPKYQGGTPYPYQQENQLFRNTGAGRFVDVSAEAGSVFAIAEVSRGAAFGDIDNDGDIDIVVTNNNGPARLLRNEVGNSKHWLSIRLRGTDSNRDGLGAEVAVLRPGKPPLWRRARTDGSYLAAHDPRVHFGLGNDDILDGVVVRWLGGHTEIWRDVVADTFTTLIEGTGEPWKNTKGT